MRREAALAGLIALCLSACRGSVPSREGIPDPFMGAVAIGGKVVLASGETRAGSLAINLEGTEGRQAESYRLPVRFERATLYQVEPGSYHVSPTRSFFGFYQSRITVYVEDEKYVIAFPRDILRKDKVVVKPGHAVPLGIVEARVTPGRAGEDPTVRIYFNDTVEARRALVEELIHDMMDSSLPLDEREHAISWSRSLQNSLVELAAEAEKPKLFKTAP